MGNPYPAVFTDQNEEGRVVGSVTFTDPSNQPGGGSSPVTKSFSFDHTGLPGLAAGVNTGIVIPAGAVTNSSAGLVQSLPITWDGSTPLISVATNQADAVSTANYIIKTSGGAPDSQFDDTVYSPANTGGPFLFIAQTTLWLAVTDGSGGNPGSNNGSGVLIITYVVP